MKIIINSELIGHFGGGGGGGINSTNLLLKIVKSNCCIKITYSAMRNFTLRNLRDNARSPIALITQQLLVQITVTFLACAIYPDLDLNELDRWARKRS